MIDALIGVVGCLVLLLLSWLSLGLRAFRQEFRAAIDKIECKTEKDLNDCKTTCCYQNRADIRQLELGKVNKTDEKEEHKALWDRFNTHSHVESGEVIIKK